MKIRYKEIALLLIGIVVLSLGLTALGGVRRDDEDDTLSVVASFYPMYTATLQVVGEVEGVSVHCLTQPTAGCLHDYQLSLAERMTLEKADLLILNGGGAEAFLDPVLPQLAASVTDTSEGLVAEECHEHEHHGHEHGAGEHGWMSPSVYAEQVQAICEALCELDPKNATYYRGNAEGYRRQIDAVGQQLAEVAEQLPFDTAVLFHDSATYTAELLGLSVIGSLPIGEEQGFSVAEVKAVADAVKGRAVLFLYDDQYVAQQEGLMAYAACSASVALNSAVLPIDGVPPEKVWLCAMEENIQALKEVAV